MLVFNLENDSVLVVNWLHARIIPTSCHVYWLLIKRSEVKSAEDEFIPGAVLFSLPRSSFVCGLAGALASNPVDVVRTRLMNQRGGALYQGTLDCILQVWNTHTHTHLCVCSSF